MSGVPLFCDPDPAVADAMRDQTGGVGVVFSDLGSLRDHLMHAVDDDTIVLGPGIVENEAFAVADYMRLQRPTLGVVLVRREVTTPILQEALRAGVRDVVDARDSRSLVSAVQYSAHLAGQMRTQGGATPPSSLPVAPPAPQRRGTVITVFSAKGGCGKTTLATNVAAALADRGGREVCIVDLDLEFGDVAITIQLYPAHTIADAIPMNGALDPAALQGLLTPHSPGLSAIVAPTEPSTAESIPPSLISHLLDVVRAQFDVVVVDTPPTFDDQVLAALDVSDVISLVVTPDVPALKNLKIAMETLTELGYSRDKFRLVLNRADAKVGITHSEVEKTAGMPLAAQIPSSREVPTSINRGVPIVREDPRHPVSVAIKRFAEAQVPRTEGALDRQLVTEFRTDRRGLMRKRRFRPT